MTKTQLKRWRISRGLSQKQAAEIIGVTERQYGNLERGVSKIRKTVALVVQTDIARNTRQA